MVGIITRLCLRVPYIILKILKIAYSAQAFLSTAVGIVGNDIPVTRVYYTANPGLIIKADIVPTTLKS